MFILLSVLVCLWHNCSSGHIEFVEESVSMEKKLFLTCRHLDSRIAILKANFTAHNDTANEFEDSRIPGIEYEPEPYALRLALNQRCSGVNHCSFLLLSDYPVSKFWGAGEIYIKYACMPDRRVTRYCNLELLIPPGGGELAQGFITSPGYPKFYLGNSECGWTIKAPDNQQIQLTLLDISLSSADIPEGYCEHELQVMDGKDDVLLTCKEKEIPPTVMSKENVLQINLIGKTKSILLKRGVLMYYSSVGCPTPDPPADGYLVYRNATSAEYMCCVGFVFPDTLQRVKVIHCLQNTWDHIIPEYCLNYSHIPFVKSSTHEEKSGKWGILEISNFEDILIPTALIVGLLFGNAVIIYVIHTYRKRKNWELQEEQELTNRGLT